MSEVERHIGKKGGMIMQDYISDWFIPMDFGNDMPDEEPNGEDNFNFE